MCTTVHGATQANILINQNYRACLADFGLSTIVSTEHHATANASLTSLTSRTSLMSFTVGGTTRWMSPELLDPERFGSSDERPTKQSDCYAFGMVVYEVRTDVIVLLSERRGTYMLSGSLRRPSFLGFTKRRGNNECDYGGQQTEETRSGGETWVHQWVVGNSPTVLADGCQLTAGC